MKEKNRGLDNRSRDDDGEIRHKRSYTLVGTLRRIYGGTFAPDVRGDMKLGTLLKRKQASSLRELRKKK